MYCFVVGPNMLNVTIYCLSRVDIITDRTKIIGVAFLTNLHSVNGFRTLIKKILLQKTNF